MLDVVVPELSENSPSKALTVSVDPRAQDLINILEACLHSRASEWQFLRELKVGTGKRNGSIQRLDAFALNCLPHQAMKRVCYEVKICRSDFLSELRHPLKRRVGMRFSNEFYFVAPGGLLHVDEIPVDCGLIEAGYASVEYWFSLQQRQAGYFHYDSTSGTYCMVTIPAPWRDTPGPTWQFVAAMLRNQQRRLAETSPPRGPEQQKLSFT